MNTYQPQTARVGSPPMIKPGVNPSAWSRRVARSHLGCSSSEGLARLIRVQSSPVVFRRPKGLQLARIEIAQANPVPKTMAPKIVNVRRVRTLAACARPNMNSDTDSSASTAT